MTTMVVWLCLDDTHKAVLQMLPHIFVGKPDRLQKIINIVSDAAKQSLKKKGMPLPPWRRADYVKAKWISPCNPDNNNHQSFSEIKIKSNPVSDQKDPILIAEFEATDEERLEEAVKQWEPLEIRPKVPKSGVEALTNILTYPAIISHHFPATANISGTRRSLNFSVPYMPMKLYYELGLILESFVSLSCITAQNREIKLSKLVNGS
ncbi:hypothetical protein R6Q59_012625 [Mikania micrantha]